MSGLSGSPVARAAANFRGFRAFRHHNYRLFFSGQLVSLVGTWMQQVAQAWLVLQLTGDPLALGLIAAAQFMPVVVLGLFGGVLADLLPKRQALLGTQVVSMALAFILFGLTAAGVVEVWHVVVLSLLLGITNSIDFPTRQAFAVEMVGRDDLRNAVGLNAATFNAARVLGPAVAGLTIAAFDISVAFLINGISYLAVIASYLRMRDADLRPAPRGPRPESVRGVFDNLAEGLRYVRRTEIVWVAVAVLGLAATFGMNFGVLIPVHADAILGVGALGYGFLMAASGVGSLSAALFVAFARRVGSMPIAWGALALGIASLVLAVSRSYPLSLIAMVAAGAGAIGMAATANTRIQLAVPDHLRGRVMSVYTTTFSASVPAGGVLMGAVASRFGVEAALGIGGVVCILVGLWAYARLRPIDLARRATLATAAASAATAAATATAATTATTAEDVVAGTTAVDPRAAPPPVLESTASSRR